MKEKPKIVVICGSSRFVEIMAVCAWLLERDEGAIILSLHLLPSWYSAERIPDHLAEHEGCADHMNDLHLRKIDIGHEILVVNYGDYVGEDTAREVGYAMDNGKKIRWFTHDPIGVAVNKIIQEAIKRANKKRHERAFLLMPRPVGLYHRRF